MVSAGLSVAFDKQWKLSISHMHLELIATKVLHVFLNLFYLDQPITEPEKSDAIQSEAMWLITHSLFNSHQAGTVWQSMCTMLSEITKG